MTLLRFSISESFSQTDLLYQHKSPLSADDGIMTCLGRAIPSRERWKATVNRRQAESRVKLAWLCRGAKEEDEVKLAWLCRVQLIFNEVNREGGRRSQLAWAVPIPESHGELEYHMQIVRYS